MPRLISVPKGKRSKLSYKQVIVVRTDLKMGKGKLAVQVAHASLLSAEETRRRKPDWYWDWLQVGQAKVAVKVGSLEELLRMRRKAEEDGLPCSLVEDSGLTQLPPGTPTCLGIGPCPKDIVNRITGQLKLL